MKSRWRRMLVLAAVFALFLPACNEDLENEDLSDNLPSFVQFTPLVGFSDVLDMETADNPLSAPNECLDGRRADVVSVTLRANVRNPDATGFPNNVVLTSYTVQFIPLDATVLDSQLPPDFTGAISRELPACSTSTFSIEIVRIQDKQFLFDLDCALGPVAGSCGAIGAACGTIRQAAAIVTFSGTDVSGHPVTLQGALTVEFGDFNDAAGPTTGLTAV
ncbi:MAG: hypothetical protein ACRDHY_10110, partial [Anaerolineales bacterium]